MGVLKLESFSHETEIRKGISRFESFESLREQAFNDGIKSGADAASRAFEAEKIRTLTPILEALNDMAFAQIEARQMVLGSLQPMIDEMVNSILPQCAAEGLGAEISAVVSRAFEKSPQCQIVIAVAPESVSSIQQLLASAKADYSVVPDATLDELGAKISWQGGHDEINLNAAIADIRTAISNFFTTTEKTGTQNA